MTFHPFHATSSRAASPARALDTVVPDAGRISIHRIPQGSEAT